MGAEPWKFTGWCPNGHPQNLYVQDDGLVLRPESCPVCDDGAAPRSLALGERLLLRRFARQLRRAGSPSQLVPPDQPPSDDLG